MPLRPEEEEARRAQGEPRLGGTREHHCSSRLPHLLFFRLLRAPNRVLPQPRPTGAGADAVAGVVVVTGGAATPCA